jgi:hypothetical protein
MIEILLYETALPAGYLLLKPLQICNFNVSSMHQFAYYASCRNKGPPAFNRVDVEKNNFKIKINKREEILLFK